MPAAGAEPVGTFVKILRGIDGSAAGETLPDGGMDRGC